MVESAHVRPIVEQIQNCIRLLFDDSNVLTARYGLRPTSNDTTAITGLSQGSQGLSLRLQSSYVRFRSRIEQNHDQTGTSKKVRWAILDRQKFVSLVEDTHQFIDGLEAVTESLERATKRVNLISEELSTLEDPEDLKLIAEASAEGSQQWSDAASVTLGASIGGASGYDRIRDWMSDVSDIRKSRVADYDGSEPSLESPEAGEGFADQCGYPSRPFLAAQLQSADFNRRLAAYLTNHVAMRSALDKAVTNTYAQQDHNGPQDVKHNIEATRADDKGAGFGGQHPRNKSG
ncbi:MAG: hypothetical protein Q9166_005512 [cf. Caloplaca sp. 2 TL-2023]